MTRNCLGKALATDEATWRLTRLAAIRPGPLAAPNLAQITVIHAGFSQKAVTLYQLNFRMGFFAGIILGQIL